MRASGYDYCNSISSDAISNFECMQADLGRCAMREPFANPFINDVGQASFLSRRRLAMVAAIVLIAVGIIGLTLGKAHDGASTAPTPVSPSSEFSAGMPLP
jgi:hypothetical protein